MGSWVIQVMSAGGYVGLVFLMFAENVFPPIPSELIMPLAGYMASQKQLALAGVIIAGTLGSVLGALPLYYAGRKLGAERVRRFADDHCRWLTVSGRDIDRAKRWFDQHGRSVVFFGRLVPGIRSLISIPAGIDRMNFAVFLAFTVAGSAIWTAFLAISGYVLGRNFEQVGQLIDPVSWIVFAVIAVLYVVRVVRHRRA